MPSSVPHHHTQCPIQCPIQCIYWLRGAIRSIIHSAPVVQVWLPAQLATYAFVPLPMRVGFQNVVMLLFNCGLAV